MISFAYALVYLQVCAVFLLCLYCVYVVYYLIVLLASTA